MSDIPWWGAAKRRSGRIRRAGVLAAAAVGAGVLVAACSSGSAGPGVAAATSSASASASASPSATGAAEALLYAQCMRSHGVPGFPDPTVQNGSVGFNITPADGVNSSSAQYQTARQACQSLRGGGTSNSGANSSANLAQALKFAQCMRSHGVPDFPDPNKDGGFSGTSTINPSSLTFQNAQSTCMRLSGYGSGSSGGAS
jgi:hypothetical protein